MKRYFSVFIVCALAIVFCFAGCAKNGTDGDGSGGANTKYPDAVMIELADGNVTVDGVKAGNDESGAVYISNDIIYYEDKDSYDSGNPYGDGDADDEHTAEEAAGNTVVNITKAGTYCISGSLPAGQIRVDLGDGAAEDPEAVVTLILDGAEITCGTAPAVLFLNVYECDNDWSTDTAGSQVDTSAAGANVVVADGSKNVITGSHVAKIYKDAEGEKKLWKQDGAVYSYMSMNIDGETEGDGVLTIIADNEGLDTELHLTINGGNIRIFSQDDGINTNEDGVSVTTINGGTIHILSGLGSEGDGIDSNGWLVINGGTVISMAHPASDAGLDSDMGSYINGGTVVSLGSTMDWPESDSEQVTVNLQFSSMQSAGDAIVFEDADGNVVFAYDPSEDEVASEMIRQYQGAVVSSPEFEVGETYQLYIGGTLTGTETDGVFDPAGVTDYTGGIRQTYSGTDVRGMGGFTPGGFPGGMQPPEGMEIPDGMEPPAGGIPDGMQPPQGGEHPEGQPPEGAEMPDRTEPPEGAEMPDRMEPPEGASDGGWNGAPGTDASREPSTEFYMQDKVNSFSGISAE